MDLAEMPPKVFTHKNPSLSLSALTMLTIIFSPQIFGFESYIPLAQDNLSGFTVALFFDLEARECSPFRVFKINVSIKTGLIGT